MSFGIVSVLNPTVVLTAGPVISAGTQSQATGTISFANSNNVTFGLSNGVMTASAAGGGGGGAGNVLAAGTQTANTSGTVGFVNGGGVTFGMTNSSQITASVETNYIAGGSTSVFQQISNTSNITSNAMNTSERANYFATAGNTFANSTHTHGAIAFSGTNVSASFTSASGGLSMALSAPAAQTVDTNKAGTGFTSTSTGGTAVAATLGTNGLSMAVPAYITTYAAQTNQTQASGNIAGVGTTFAGTNVTATVGLNSNGLALSLSAPSPGGGGAVNFIAGTTNANLQTVSFGDANNVSFGLNGATITATATFAQSADTNKAGIGYTSTTQAGTTVGATHNTAGLSMAWPPFITTYVAQTAQTQAAGNIAGTGYTSTTQTGTTQGVTLGTNGLSIAQPAFITTYVNDLTSGRAGVGYTSTTQAGTTAGVTQNTSGLSMAWPAFITTYVAQTTQTQAAGSIAGIGYTSTTQAGTAIGATLSTNGLSLAQPAFITTAMASDAGSNFMSTSERNNYFFTSNNTFANQIHTHGAAVNFTGVNISASFTSNATALSMSFSAGGGGGTTNQTGPNIADGNGNTVTSGTVVFSNANGISFGLNASTMTASYNSTQFAALAHTHGAAVNFTGVNVSASFTSNATALSMSLSVAAGGGAGATMQDWQVFPMAASSMTSIASGTLFLCPILPAANVSFTAIEQVWSNSISSTSGAGGWSKSMSFSYGLYAEGTGTNTTRMELLSSSSVGLSVTGSSNVSIAYTYGAGANTTSFSSAGLSHSFWNAQKVMSLPFSGSMSAGGLYYFAQNMSTASAGSNVAATWSQMINAEATNASFVGFGNTTINASNKSQVQEPYGFILSVSTAAFPANFAYSDASIYSNYQPFLYFEA